MTTQFDPTLAASLAAQAKEDDAALTPGEWGVYQDTPFDPIQVNAPSRDVLQFDTWEHRPDEREPEAHAIARTRNNLLALAEQLTAACASLAEVTKERDEAFAKVDSLYESIEAGTSHKTALRMGEMMLAAQAQRDAALAECEGLKKENERMRATAIEAALYSSQYGEDASSLDTAVEMLLGAPIDAVTESARDAASARAAISTALQGDKP